MIAGALTFLKGLSVLARIALAGFVAFVLVVVLVSVHGCLSSREAVQGAQDKAAVERGNASGAASGKAAQIGGAHTDREIERERETAETRTAVTGAADAETRVGSETYRTAMRKLCAHEATRNDPAWKARCAELEARP